MSNDTTLRTVTLQGTPQHFAGAVKTFDRQVDHGQDDISVGPSQTWIPRDIPVDGPLPASSMIMKPDPNGVEVEILGSGTGYPLTIEAWPVGEDRTAVTATCRHWDAYDNLWDTLIEFLQQMGLADIQPADQSEQGAPALLSFNELLNSIGYDESQKNIPKNIKQDIEQWYYDGGENTIGQQEMADAMARSIDTVKRIIGTKK